MCIRDSVCAYLGGVLDRIFDVVSNIFMAFPPFLVAITLVGLFESKVFSIILSIVIAMWVWNARVVRTYVLREKQKPYVITCRMSGCSELRLSLIHICFHHEVYFSWVFDKSFTRSNVCSFI